MIRTGRDGARPFEDHLPGHYRFIIEPASALAGWNAKDWQNAMVWAGSALYLSPYGVDPIPGSVGQDIFLLKVVLKPLLVLCLGSNVQNGYDCMLAEAAAQHSNPNLKARMSNECILLFLYPIGPHPPFDIWILAFDILVKTIVTKYSTKFWDTTIVLSTPPPQYLTFSTLKREPKSLVLIGHLSI